MQSMTNREFRTWSAWLDEQWNEPDRTDYYLMQVAGYVSHVLSKKSWKLDDFKINFKLGVPVVAKDEKQKKLERSKALWNARLNRSKEKDCYGR